MKLAMFTKVRTLLTKLDNRLTSDEIKKRAICIAVMVGLASVLMPEFVNAALPWESPLAQIAQSLCGPVAKTFGIVALVGAGLMIAFGEVKGWIHNMMIVLIGISIAILSPTFLSMLGLGTSVVPVTC